MSAKAILSASVSAGPAVYVEDVFSTYLYTGNGGTQTITNGIDLAGEGGLTWIKSRTTAFNHTLVDTVRGATNLLVSNTSAAQATQANSLTAFTSTGFSIGAGSIVNYLADNIASWTFRKAPKFFDIVTWTGNYPTNYPRVLSHSLGSTPGFVIIKRTDGVGSWQAWHRSVSTGDYNANQTLFLHTTAAAVNYGNQAGPFTSTTITVGENLNQAGQTFVAYLFAHDAGGFGDAGTDNVVSCGTFSSTGQVTLGYEPQWVMMKSTTDNSDYTGDWRIFDNMRGISIGGDDNQLFANSSRAEDTGTFGTAVSFNATGFNVEGQGNFGSSTIYIAIRRGPMKTPESGTEVFAVDQGDSSTTNPQFRSNFVTDFATFRAIGEGNNWETTSRLQGFRYMRTNLASAEASDGNIKWDYMNGFYSPVRNSNFYAWMFRRAPGFFDVVAYTGTGATNTTVPHNLTVTPELAIFKNRTTAGYNWVVKTAATFGTNSYLILEGANTLLTNASYGATATASQFTLSTGGGNAGDWNQSGGGIVAYLFATLTGVSKVGSYTGTGTTLNVDCGFTTGARFVLIKRTDSTGDWFVWDTARGIVSGNDSYLLLNSTAAEVTNTDYIDPLASGFQISSTAPAAINANGGSYIFLAVA